MKTLPANGDLTPVGVYKGISYSSNFIVASVSTLNESADGVIPHSNPNVALGTSSPTSLTAVYSGSKTKSFSLSSYYYGCVEADFNGVLSVAVACIITASGYKAGLSSPFTSQVFKFTSQETVDVMNPPTLGMFSSKFNNLQKVTLAFQSPATPVALIVDNLVGTTTS